MCNFFISCSVSLLNLCSFVAIQVAMALSIYVDLLLLTKETIYYLYFNIHQIFVTIRAEPAYVVGFRKTNRNCKFGTLRFNNLKYCK